MILIRDLKVERIGKYYKLKCCKTQLEAEGYGLQKVAKELNEKCQDNIWANKMESRKSYTQAGSATRSIREQAQC